MKATELRVNNLVHFGLSNIVRVKSINPHTCICKAKYSISGKDVLVDMISFSGDTASGNVPIESFWGIPLTEEILLKCGFKKTEEYYAADEENVDVYTIGCFDIAFIDNEYKLWIAINEDSYYNFAWTKIKYLHQLQNLYWCLTGQELEVNL